MRAFRIAFLVFSILLLQCPTAKSQSSLALSDYGATGEGEVKILRDTFGVPHVVSGERDSLFFGAGYALAQDQLERLALNYLSANGRAAEVLGADEAQNDQLVHLLGIPGRAAEGYDNLDAQMRSMLDAYVDGINSYISSVDKAELPEWLPVIRPQDAVAFGLYVNAMFAINDCIGDLRRNGVKLSYTAPFRSNGIWGSNQFAVSPSKSASGSCMLSMDPHLRHSGFFLWHEMHLIGPGINAMGASLIGLPFVGMGRTADTGWCMTVNGPDLGDIFVLEINPANPLEYKAKSGWKPFDIRQQKLKIKVGERLVEKSLKILNSDFGPVISVDKNRAFAAKISIPPGDAGIQQGFRMMTAGNLGEFKEALKLRGLLMFNILYGDRTGEIFFVSNGRVGKRSERIDSHQLRPAAEEWADWKGIHEFEELPQLQNPASGFLMNTNSGPQTVTQPGALKVDDFPSYMIGHSNNSRSRRLQKLLLEDGSVTWDELMTYATDTKLEAEQTLARVIDLLSQEPKGSATEARGKLEDVVAVLKKWDMRADTESKGTALFFHLLNDELFIAALEGADAGALQGRTIVIVEQFIQSFGKLDIEWAKFSRIRHGSNETGMAGWPATGGVGSTLRPIFGRISNGKYYCGGGSSYGMLVDFSGKTKSVSCLPFGVSGNSESPHFNDMLPLYAKRRFKPTYFLPEDLRANTESVTVLNRE